MATPKKGKVDKDAEKGMTLDQAVAAAIAAGDEEELERLLDDRYFGMDTA